MSHFSVVVCLDDKDGTLARAAAVQGDGFQGAARAAAGHRLEEVLAPYDENLEVEPYRDYEEGGPEDYWVYRSLKRAAEDERDGTGILPYRPDELGWSSASSKKTPDEQRLDIAREAALFRSLPEPVTWEALIDAGRTLYADSDWPEIDEDGRAYTVSTSNPDAKWDYWRVGGRWGGKVAYRPERALEVIGTEKDWDSPEDVPLLRCDGGPKRALDLAAMREDAAEKAHKAYREYHSAVAGLPEGRPWREFAARAEAGGGLHVRPGAGRVPRAAPRPCAEGNRLQVPGRRDRRVRDRRHAVRREGPRAGGPRLRHRHHGRQVDGSRPDGLVRRDRRHRLDPHRVLGSGQRLHRLPAGRRLAGRRGLPHLSGSAR